MKRCKVRSLILTMLLITFVWANMAAAGYRSIPEALDAIELRLNELESKQNQELGELTAQIEAIAVPADDSRVSEVESSIADLGERMEALAIQLNAESQDPEQTPDAVVLAALLNDLRQLSEEIRVNIQPVEPEPPVVAVVEPVVEPVVAQEEPNWEDSMPPMEVAETESEAGGPTLEISGFADFQHTPSTSEGRADDPFAMGQAELDLGSSLSDEVAIGAALAFDGDAFALGALTIDFHLFGEEGHFLKADNIDNSGVILGQFDVPFGIDYQVYVSLDRDLISPPLVVQSTHAAWNDYGAIGYLENSWTQVSVFGTNGFGYEAGFDSGTGVLLGYNGVGYDQDTRADLDVVEFDPSAAIGGRWGVRPTEMVEVGASYVSFLDSGNTENMSLLGADLQVNMGPWEAKGEVISQELGSNYEDSQQAVGYYAQGLYRYGNHYVVARIGSFNDGSEDAEDQGRFSLGNGWEVVDNCVLRMEYQSNSSGNDFTTMQVAVGF